MTRTHLIRAIAILLISLGVWYFVDLFLQFFVPGAGKGIRVFNLLYTAFLVEAGLDLYRFKESGRTLAVALFLIRVFTNLGVAIWVLLLKGEVTQGAIYLFGTPFPVADSRETFVLILLAWSLLVLLLAAFLVQKKTKEVFAGETRLGRNNVEDLN